jgi:hypothetical protein
VALIDQMVAWLECDSGKVRSASNIVGQVRPVRTDITRGHEQAPSPGFWNTAILARLAWLLLAGVFAAYASRALARWGWP